MIAGENVSGKTTLLKVISGLLLPDRGKASVYGIDVTKNWKKLHRFVYAAGILAALHFILAVKPGVLRPWPYALVMSLLLLFRLLPVQAWVKKTI